MDLLFQYLISKDIKKCLLLVDSWSSNKNTKLFEEILTKYEGQLTVERLLIPEGLTSMIKPLDVYYFQPYKQFVRHISDSLEVCDKIWKRDNYFKLQALAHFKFQAPRFRNMIKLAFYKAGYLDEHPEAFKTLTQFCFSFEKFSICSHSNCEQFSDFKYAHCTKCYCFKHY